MIPLRAASALTLVILAAGCSPTVTTTTRPHATPATTSAEAAPTDLTCGTPGEALVEQAKLAIASHPGPVLATTLVPAATTETGSWSILGIERAHVRDDGSSGGSSSRDFALVDVDPDAANSRMIPVSTNDWTAVSWRGETLAAGKRALAFAANCLQEQQAGARHEP